MVVKNQPQRKLMKGGASLVLGIVLIVSTAVLVAAHDKHPSNLRTPKRYQQSEQQQESQEHLVQHDSTRRLEEFTLPFSVQWSLEIGNGGTDRQPTAEEYQGLVDSSVEWFTDTIEKVYGDFSEADFQSVQARLVPEETSWDAAKQTYPHVIQVEMDSFWEANERSDLPLATDFLPLLRDNSVIVEFVRDYLIPGQNGGLFSFTQRAAYITSATTPGSPTSPTAPTPAEPTAPLPTAPTPTAPAPISPPANPTGLANTYAVPFGVVFSMGIGLGASDREATDEELLGAAIATKQYYQDGLTSHYAGETEFVYKDIIIQLINAEWKPTADDGFTHDHQYEAAVLFDANSINDIPTSLELFTIFRFSGHFTMTDYRANYLATAEPSGSLYHSTNQVQSVSQQSGVPGQVATPTPQPPTAPTVPPPTVTPPTPAQVTPTAPSPTGTPPTPAPVTPQGPSVGVGGTTGVNREDLIDAVSVSTALTFEYRLQDDFNREPTEEEFIGLCDSTVEFWRKTFTEMYQDTPNTNFVTLDGKWNYTQYTPGATFPYTARYVTDVLFKEGSQVPLSEAFRQLMSQSLPGSDYVSDYVWKALPDSSLFRSTVEYRWDF